MNQTYGNINRLKEMLEGGTQQSNTKNIQTNLKALQDDNRFEEEEIKETNESNLFKFKEKETTKPTTTDEMYEETKRIINKVTDEIYDRDPKQIAYVSKLADFRGLKPETLINHGCFYIQSPDYIESLFSDLPLFRDYLEISNSSNTLWKTRLVIPIRDFYGEVYGFVGWDKFSNAKYVEYSAELYRKSTLKVIGLPNVSNILDSKYVILTEGSFDYFRGIQNDLSILANLGISFNKRLKPLLSKLDVVFTAYDSDEAGTKNMNTIDKLHPNVYHIIFNDIEKIDDEGNTKKSKCDLDDAGKNLANIEKLKYEIDLRVSNPYLKLKDIYI